MSAFHSMAGVELLAAICMIRMMLNTTSIHAAQAALRMRSEGP